MTVRIAAAAAERERVAAALPDLVAALPEPLEAVAQGVLGLDAEIDLVARGADGTAVVVRVASAGEELAALADLAAQCAWLAPRVRDWQRLAPALHLVPERGARGLLVAPGFDARTRAAAAAMPAIALARVVALEWDGRPALALEALPAAPAAPGRQPREPVPPPAEFRSGLRDEDLGLPRRPTRLAPRG